jgi:four helix bundle protein
LQRDVPEKSKIERNRYFEISRGSVIEIDAALDIAYELTYTTMEQMQFAGNTIVNTFKLLSGMIKREDDTHN